MNLKTKRATLPMRTAIKLGLSGHWVLRFFTILILSVCFTTLGLISTFFTGNYTDAFIECVLNSAYEYTAFCFRESDKLYETDEIVTPIGQEVMDFIEEETGKSYIHIFSYAFNICDLDCYIGTVTETTTAKQPYPWGVYAKDNATYEDFGFNLLAGRYPEGLYEIAVSEKQFEYFKENGGYCDRSAGFYYDGRGDDLHWSYDETKVAEQEVEDINDYEDLIGKTVMCRGDAENGVLAKSGSQTGGFYFVKIVGVIDTHADESTRTYSIKWDYSHYNPRGKIFVSEEWLNRFYPDGDYISAYMCTQKATTRAEAREFISIAEKARSFADSLIAKKQAEAKALYATSDGLGLIETSEFNTYWQDDLGMFIVFGGVGGIFGIFAVVLVIYLTSATLNGKRRQIGVLRAIGAGRRDVAKIVFSGVGFNSGVSLVVSVSATFLLYKLWLYNLFYASYLGSAFVFFNIWNVLILAAVAVIVPLLASLPALGSFLKRSVAEILTNRKTAKTRK